MNRAERLNEIRETKYFRQFEASAVLDDDDSREIELSFSSDTDEGRRGGGAIEILGHNANEVDLSRLNNAAPLLWMHDWSDQRGVVVRAWIEGRSTGRAVVRLSKSSKGEELFQDIKSGIVTKVSVGYRVQEIRWLNDDEDAYRVTKWQPFEISMVSVPFDDTVGVGRALEPLSPAVEALTNEIRAAGPSHPLYHLAQPRAADTQETRTQMTVASDISARRSAAASFRELMEAARNETGLHQTYDGNGQIIHTIESRAAAMRHLNIRDLELPIFAGNANSLTYVPTGEAPGKVSRLSTLIAQNSRSIAAGAHLLVLQDAPTPTASDERGLVAFTKRQVSFMNIEAAPFTMVDSSDVNGSGIPETVTPYFRQDVDFKNLPFFGFRTKVSRYEQKYYENGEIPEILASSIFLGLMNLCDQVMLSAIAATNPTAFTYAAAAAKNVRIGDLRAITDGQAARQDSENRLIVSPVAGAAGGVIAELSPNVTGTVVGAWDRACLALHENITLIADRARNISGDLIVTCQVNAQALLPQGNGFFWTL